MDKDAALQMQSPQPRYEGQQECAVDQSIGAAPHGGLDSYELGSWTERTLEDITKLSRGFWWNTKTMEAV